MPGLDETFHSWTVKMPKFIQETFGLDKEPNIEVYKRKKKFDIKAAGHGVNSTQYFPYFS